MKKNYDFVVVGGGIVGLSIAHTLLSRGFKSIAVLEKENTTGVHASGRNSGVLHSGIYYASDSLKARFCADGATALRQYAEEKKIPLNVSGKVIVASNEEELAQLHKLYDQAQKNGAQVSLISIDELKKIEPLAFSVEKALHSPLTAVIDSKAVLNQLSVDLRDRGVDILFSQPVVKINSDEQSISLPNSAIHYGHLFNCAGLHADDLAHQMGVGYEYAILPFKGIYRKLSPHKADLVRGSIYPVPNIRMPFLGTHITKSVYGDVYLGPTAIPAFGRENYGIFDNIKLRDSWGMLKNLSLMFLQNRSGIRSLIKEELTRYTSHGFFKAVHQLAPDLRKQDILQSAKVGLRAQLVHIPTLKLEMDFKVLDGPKSTHVLNAISPAFTSCFPFASFVVDKMKGNSIE